MQIQRFSVLLSVTVVFSICSSSCLQAQYQEYSEGQVIESYPHIEHVIVDPNDVPAESYVVVEPEEVEWIQDYEAAREMAVQTSRPVLLFITSDGCHYCEMMRREVFRDSTIVAKLKSSFVAAKVKIDPEGELAKQLKITLYPTTVIIDADGTVLNYARGYRKVSDMQSRIADVISQQIRVARN